MTNRDHIGDVPAPRERLEARHAELKREVAIGEQRLHELAAEQARVRDTVLRLEGAILAYGELLDPDRAGRDRVPVPQTESPRAPDEPPTATRAPAAQPVA